MRAGETQLFISHVKLHKAVKPCTISKWILGLLELLGIDINTFEAHSTRAAATSKATSLGVSLAEVLKRGRWSNSSTFQKFYLRSTIEFTDFESAIIEGK